MAYYRDLTVAPVRILSDEYAGDPPATAAVVEYHTGQAAAAMRDAAREIHAAVNISATMAAATTVDIDGNE